MRPSVQRMWNAQKCTDSELTQDTWVNTCKFNCKKLEEYDFPAHSQMQRYAVFSSEQ